MDGEKLNQAIRDWGRITTRKLIRQVVGLTLKDRYALRKSIQHAARDPQYKKLVKSIGTAYGKSFGQIDRVNFRFARHGIFFERGVGGKKGGGTVSHTPKPWLSSVVNPAIDDLADILAQEYADLAAGEIKFTVPGIANRRIRIENGQ